MWKYHSSSDMSTFYGKTEYNTNNFEVQTRIAPYMTSNKAKKKANRLRLL